jgi:hypothetical protein
LNPENSVYSFVHYRPENISKEARSILSTTIPGLEILVQPTAQQTSVAHVKAGDQISGTTVLSLMSTCPMVKLKNNKWVANKSELSTVMTVNRNYDIPMRVGYGIKARLNSKVAAKAFADLVATATDNKLSKTQVYNQFLEVSGDEVFSVKIETDFVLSDTQKKDLEHDVRKRLVDRFLMYFEMRGDLAKLAPLPVPAPEGGMIPVEQVGTKCWSKSSWGGLKKKGGCTDYVYTVQKWRDGKTTAEIQDHLSVDLDISEVKQINDVVDVPMTTVFFEKEEEKENNNENN